MSDFAEIMLERLKGCDFYLTPDIPEDADEARQSAIGGPVGYAALTDPLRGITARKDALNPYIIALDGDGVVLALRVDRGVSVADTVSHGGLDSITLQRN